MVLGLARFGFTITKKYIKKYKKTKKKPNSLSLAPFFPHHHHASSTSSQLLYFLSSFLSLFLPCVKCSPPW